MLLLSLPSGSVLAAPGDIHRETGAQVVTLRAGPSEESNIRDAVQGDDVVDFTRDGNWVALGALDTGEGIYGGLFERVATSGLVPGDADGSGGREAHLLGALAFYELWKNHQDGRPVTLAVADGDMRPELAVVAS